MANLYTFNYVTLSKSKNITDVTPINSDKHGTCQLETTLRTTLEDTYGTLSHNQE